MTDYLETHCWIITSGPNAGLITDPVTELPPWLELQDTQIADGAIVSSRAYPELARIMRRNGYPFGRVSRYRFNLPDMRGRVTQSA